MTPGQVAEHLSCGPDVQGHVDKIQPFIDAGFTEIAFAQVGGGHQQEFIGRPESELLPALRSL